MLRLIQDEYGVYQDGNVEVTREPDSIFQLYYRIYNPTGDLTPLVILHGGPSLPSPYLYPLVPMLSQEQRPIIFHDQLGCGNSDEPKDLSCYSIPLFVQDLAVVLDHTLSRLGPAKPFLDNRPKCIPPHSFHLLGHSFGGSLAYEYVRHQQPSTDSTSLPGQPSSIATTTTMTYSSSLPSPSKNGVVVATCQSLILCNAIQNMRISNDNYDRLFHENPQGFWTRHACRVGIPPSLQLSLNQLGTTWNGMTSVLDYVASHNNQTSNNHTNDSCWTVPPCLILTGEYDFARPASNDQVWKPLLQGSNVVESFEFLDCGHYPFYEESDMFGQMLRRFLERVDGNIQPS